MHQQPYSAVDEVTARVKAADASNADVHSLLEARAKTAVGASYSTIYFQLTPAQLHHFVHHLLHGSTVAVSCLSDDGSTRAPSPGAGCGHCNPLLALQYDGLLCVTKPPCRVSEVMTEPLCAALKVLRAARAREEHDADAMAAISSATCGVETALVALLLHGPPVNPPVVGGILVILAPASRPAGPLPGVATPWW